MVARRFWAAYRQMVWSRRRGHGADHDVWSFLSSGCRVASWPCPGGRHHQFGPRAGRSDNASFEFGPFDIGLPRSA